MALNGVELLDYACLKFQEKKYDEALEAFVLAYGKGVEKEWIMNNIYSCYMDANEEEFRKTYEKQAGETEVGYEDCTLDFIPYKEGEYYIFDKEEAVFRGVFSVPELQKIKQDASLQRVEFSAAILGINWNWNDELAMMSEALRRKLYVLVHDKKRFISFYKIPELTEYVKNIEIFETIQECQNYFHKNTSVYLPKIICGMGADKKELDRILEEEHRYRLTPEGRNTENVLLTIGIPTHERGNLLLKRMENLLMMSYDAEIEIAVSKNGNKRYQEEYRTVSNMSDARINYYDHREEIHSTINWSYVIEMAHGKYVMLVSDEDDVVIGELEHYLKLLRDHPDLSLLRAKSRFQNPIDERVYGKKGLEAFSYEFTRQNYLSGLIIKREAFLQCDVLRLNKDSDNPYYQYYPHEWWCAYLSQKGDYMTEPVTLIDEQDSVGADEVKQLIEEGKLKVGEAHVKGTDFPVFATYKERLNQFRGMVDFLHIFCEENIEMAVVGLSLAIGKTACLFELARTNDYASESYIDMMNIFVDRCIETIDEFSFRKEQKRDLLVFTEDCCQRMYHVHVSRQNG